MALICLGSLFLVCTCHRMLEPGRIGGVTGDGYIHIFLPHDSHTFRHAEGAIGIAEKANKVRQKPLRVILNGLGKDAAKIISRINGFTFVETEYDPYTNST